VSDYYARQMPYLGFDPAPGDGRSVEHLARQHHSGAEEIRLVSGRAAAVDLSAWQGDAATVTGLIRDQMVTALNGLADAMDTLSQTCSAWARQLSVYQGEADALEQQARTATEEHTYLQQRQKALRLTGSTATYAELDSAQSRLLQIEQQAQDLHQDYEQAAAKLANQLDAHTSLWDEIFGPDGVIRTWDERLHSPTDLMAADLIIARLIGAAEANKEDAERIVEASEKWVKELPSALKEAFEERYGNVFARLRDGDVTESDLAAELRDFTSDWDGLDRLNAAFLKAGGDAVEAAGPVLGVSQALGGTLDVMAIVADMYTVWRPSDGGTAGDVDRGMAVANAAAAGLDLAEIAGVNMALDWIPGVGEVVGVATGLYLAGDWLYHHWTPFHDFADDTGHVAVSVSKDVWHSISSVF
jgi:hypothetical protein